MKDKQDATKREDKLSREKAMTLDDYKRIYSQKENTFAVRTALYFGILGIGVLLFCCMFMIPLRLYEINEAAGYVGFGLMAILYVFLFVVPLVRLYRKKAFILGSDKEALEKTKKHNRRLIRSIAVEMVDLHEKADIDKWYSDEKIEVLKSAKNDKEMRMALTNIYDTDVRFAAGNLIRKYAIKVAMTTAISQSAVVDSALIVGYEFSMIKDLVFLYGFRPTDAQMAKMNVSVFSGALAAYGLQNSTGTLFSNSFGKVVQQVPFIGELLSTLATSATQGAINATLTYLIGKQAQKYLRDEYKLQDVLDRVIPDDETDTENLREILNDFGEEFKRKSVRKKNETEDSEEKGTTFLKKITQSVSKDKDNETVFAG